jgi:hypothetical protein
MMKRLTLATALAAATFAVSIPAVSFAQSNDTITRAQVKAELRALEQAGYNPARGEDPDYPSDIQAAEDRVIRKNLASRSDIDNSMGGVTGNSSISGKPTP